MKAHVFLAAAVVSVLAGRTHAVVISDPTGVVNPANGHKYYLLSQNTWAASEAEGVARGGHLATVNDAAENTWIFDRFGGFGGAQRLLWIGYNDAAVEGQFRWTSGETPAYTNWTPGEPNALNNVENFAAIYYPGHSSQAKWNDWNDRTSDPIGLQFNGVVEVVPEPAAGLAAFGALALAALRRRRSSAGA